MVLYGVCIVGRQRRHLKSTIFRGNPAGCLRTLFLIPHPLFLVVLYGVYAAGRQRRYLEAGVFSFSGGLVGRVRSRASA